MGVLMDDRIAERPDYEAAKREAAVMGWASDSWRVDRIVDAAIGDRLLVDSDALIIRRDRIDYEAAWKLYREWTSEEWTVLSAGELKAVVDAALASSEGVEP